MSESLLSLRTVQHISDCRNPGQISFLVSGGTSGEPLNQSRRQSLDRHSRLVATRARESLAKDCRAPLFESKCNVSFYYRLRGSFGAPDIPFTFRRSSQIQAVDRLQRAASISDRFIFEIHDFSSRRGKMQERKIGKSVRDSTILCRNDNHVVLLSL